MIYFVCSYFNVCLFEYIAHMKANIVIFMLIKIMNEMIVSPCSSFVSFNLLRLSSFGSKLEVYVTAMIEAADI